MRFHVNMEDDHCPAFQESYERLKKQKQQDKNYLVDHWEDSDAHEEYHSMWDGVDLVQLAQENANIVFPAVWPWLSSS